MKNITRLILSLNDSKIRDMACEHYYEDKGIDNVDDFRSYYIGDIECWITAAVVQNIQTFLDTFIYEYQDDIEWYFLFNLYRQEIGMIEYVQKSKESESDEQDLEIDYDNLEIDDNSDLFDF